MILRKLYCGGMPECPTIESKDGGLELVGTRIEDPNLPPHESRIRWTEDEARRIAPELVDPRIPDLGAYLDAHHRVDLIRVQTLDRYSVASDDQDYARYVSGEPRPLSPYREPWHAKLRELRAAGKAWRNVHVARLPLNDYLRFQFEWWYAGNVTAGQDVRILDTTVHPEAEFFFGAGDFYVIDGVQALEMRYDDFGRFVGSVAAPAPATAPYATLAELAWNLATPFDQWWADHTEFHRTNPLSA